MHFYRTESSVLWSAKPGLYTPTITLQDKIIDTMRTCEPLQGLKVSEIWSEISINLHYYKNIWRALGEFTLPQFCTVE